MTTTLGELATRMERLEGRVDGLERPPGAVSEDVPVGRWYGVNDGLLWGVDGPPVEWKDSPNQGGRSKPRKLIVIHYTAGRSFDHTSRYFMRDTSDVSSHVVISKDPKDPVRQFVNLQRRAWHVGKSKWRGQRSLNGIALGIELDNAGPVKSDGAGGYEDRWGQPVADVYHHHADGTVWEAYPADQLVTAAEIVLAMIQNDDGIVAVTGHQHVATPTGRKVDPGPAFPWDDFALALTMAKDVAVGP